MNKNDIGRMVSLADERYVDEMLEERITLNGRKRNGFTGFAAMAAAAAVVIGGIWCFASTAGNIDEPLTPIPAEQSRVADNLGAQPFDYASLFKNRAESEFPLSFTVERESSVLFDIDYVKSIIPFSAEGYSDSRSQTYAYCDGNNEPFGIGIFFESEFVETASPKFRAISIYMCTEGHITHDLPLDETEPVKYLDVDIYGFDDTAHYYEGAYDKNLKAYFVIGNTEYAVDTANLSCEETVNIIRDIIQSDFSIKDFDMSEGSDFDYEVTTVSFEEANTIEPFAGYIPQVNDVFYHYNKGPYYQITKINGEIYCKSLSFSYTDGTNSDDEKRIHFEYYTRSTGRGAKPFDNTVNLQTITRESLDNFIIGDEYKFTINCDGFMINVTAKCTANELWTYIENIKGNSENVGVRLSNGMLLVDSTTSAANKIKPFAGYIPQSESFGNLKLSAVSEGYFDGDALPCLIHLVYVDDLNDTAQMLTAHFFSDHKAITIDEPKFSVVPLDELSPEDVAPGKSIVVDCGDFEILIEPSSKCSKEDIWRFINEVKGLAAYDADEDMKRLEEEKEKQKRIEEEISKLQAEKEEQERKLAEQNAAFERIVKGGDEALTLEKVKKLAQKGDKLDWSDFENFSGTEVGSGLFIMAYSVENTDYWVHVGGVPGEKPWYVYLSEDWNEQRIDIRYDSIDDFLQEKTLTIDKVKELAKKGDDLTWSDFEGFSGTDIGSGLYIMSYAVEGTDYTVLVGGGSTDEKPMYIYLSGKGKRIDIRYDSIDEFLS